MIEIVSDPEVNSAEENQPLLLVPVTADDEARGRRRVKLIVIAVLIVVLAAVGYMYKRYMDPLNAKESFDAGTRLFKIARYNQAILSFDRAIALKPDLTDAYQMRGRCYMALSEPERAVQDFTKVIEQRPNDPTGWIDRGSAYVASNKFSQAVADATKAIAVDPRRAAAFNLRGVAIRKSGAPQKALDDFNHAVELEKSADNYFERGATYQAMGEHRLAIADFDQVIKIIPDLASPFFARAESRRALGDAAGAQQDHRQGRILDGH